MLRQLAVLLPSSARAGWASVASARTFATLNTEDPVVMKQFIGLTDALGYEPEARQKLTGLLQQLLDIVKAIPESSDYRKAVEATAQYRLKVLEQNESNTAVEEVLDSHMEELILETKEEIALVPVMTGEIHRMFCTALSLLNYSRQQDVLVASDCMLIATELPLTCWSSFADFKPYAVAEDFSVSGYA